MKALWAQAMISSLRCRLRHLRCAWLRKNRRLCRADSLKKAMSAPAFERLINSLLNINLGEDALLLVAGDERVRTELIGKYLPVLKAAFNVSNVRVVGGARNGLDAY